MTQHDLYDEEKHHRKEESLENILDQVFIDEDGVFEDAFDQTDPIAVDAPHLPPDKLQGAEGDQREEGELCDLRDEGEHRDLRDEGEHRDLRDEGEHRDLRDEGDHREGEHRDEADQRDKADQRDVDDGKLVGQQEGQRERSLDDVLNESGPPKKSAKVYNRAWELFVQWMNRDQKQVIKHFLITNTCISGTRSIF